MQYELTMAHHKLFQRSSRTVYLQSAHENGKNAHFVVCHVEMKKLIGTCEMRSSTVPTNVATVYLIGRVRLKVYCLCGIIA